MCLAKPRGPKEKDVCPLFYLKIEAESSFQNIMTLFIIDMMDKVHGNSFTDYNAQSSETFRLLSSNMLDWKYITYSVTDMDGYDLASCRCL